MIRQLLRLVLASVALGCVAGLVTFALVKVFEPAFMVLGAVSSRGGPAALIVLACGALGWGGAVMKEGIADESGPLIDVPLALVAGGTALGLSYALAAHSTGLPPDVISILSGLGGVALGVPFILKCWIEGWE